jgi:hypothetical protein
MVTVTYLLDLCNKPLQIRYYNKFLRSIALSSTVCLYHLRSATFNASADSGQTWSSFDTPWAQMPDRSDFGIRAHAPIPDCNKCHQCPGCFNYIFNPTKNIYVQPFVGLYAIGAGNLDEPLHLTLFVDACAATNSSMCGAAGTGFRNLPIYAVGGGFDEDDKDLEPTDPFTFQIGDACKPPTPPPSVPTRPPSHAPSPAPRTPTQQPTDAGAGAKKKPGGAAGLGIVLGGLTACLLLAAAMWAHFRKRKKVPTQDYESVKNEEESVMPQTTLRRHKNEEENMMPQTTLRRTTLPQTTLPSRATSNQNPHHDPLREKLIPTSRGGKQKQAVRRNPETAPTGDAIDDPNTLSEHAPPRGVKQKESTALENALNAASEHEICYETLRVATANFGSEKVLGEGSFARVYLGELEGKKVAVKVDKYEGGRRCRRCWNSSSWPN